MAICKIILSALFLASVFAYPALADLSQYEIEMRYRQELEIRNQQEEIQRQQQAQQEQMRALQQQYNSQAHVYTNMYGSHYEGAR